MDKNRLGKCYELTGAKMIAMDVDNAPQLTLVHGVIGLPEHYTPHAWITYFDPAWKIEMMGQVVMDGIVAWEPVTEEIYPVDIFTALFRAQAMFEYPYEEMREIVLREEDWGPWDGDYWIIDENKKVAKA